MIYNFRLTTVKEIATTIGTVDTVLTVFIDERQSPSLDVEGAEFELWIIATFLHRASLLLSGPTRPPTFYIPLVYVKVGVKMIPIVSLA